MVSRRGFLKLLGAAPILGSVVDKAAATAVTPGIETESVTSPTANAYVAITVDPRGRIGYPNTDAAKRQVEDNLGYTYKANVGDDVYFVQDSEGRWAKVYWRKLPPDLRSAFPFPLHFAFAAQSIYYINEGRFLKKKDADKPAVSKLNIFVATVAVYKPDEGHRKQMGRPIALFVPETGFYVGDPHFKDKLHRFASL
jgi:hypothetical protein